MISKISNLLVFLALASTHVVAQCTFSGRLNPDIILPCPTAKGDTLNVSECNRYGDYAEISGFTSLTEYTLGISDGGYITVFNEAAAIVAFGSAPLKFTPPSDGKYRIQWNGIGCATENNACHTTFVINTGPASPCSNPISAIKTESSVEVACPDTPFLLTLKSASIGSGITYQWQSSLDGITFNDIQGATHFSYLASQSTQTFYQCNVTCSSGSPATSVPLSVNMGPCITMSDTQVTTCSGNFYDSGGPTGKYLINEDYTITFTPSTPGSYIQLMFHVFDIEEKYDKFTVYDGNSTSAPLLGTFDTHPGSITSGASDGSLTLVFQSDMLNTLTGWEAVIGCVSDVPTNDDACQAIVLPVDGSVNNYSNALADVAFGEATISPPATGGNETDGWENATLQHSVWFSFQAPTSGNVSISCTDKLIDGQVAIYAAQDCSDFGTFDLIAANDNDVDSLSKAPKFTVCGLVPEKTYYLMYDSGNDYASGPFSISLNSFQGTAGISADTLEVCGGDTVHLFRGISGYDSGGIWKETIPTFGLKDSIWNTSGVAFRVFDFLYIIEKGCLIDTAVSHVNVFGPSSAGNDGTIQACRQEKIYLLSGLSGNVDLGGDWYNPLNQVISETIVTTGDVPGQFNYDYIARNGVCPDDTSNILLIVNDCVAGLDEFSNEKVSVYPNPSNGVFYVDVPADLAGSFRITDISGKNIPFVAYEEGAKKRIESKHLNPGVYFLILSSEGQFFTQRLIFQ